MVLDGEVGREMIVRRREKGSQTSFETFLRSLPKLDPVDRTVEWVLAQPDDTMVSPTLPHFSIRSHFVIIIREVHEWQGKYYNVELRVNHRAKWIIMRVLYIIFLKPYMH